MAQVGAPKTTLQLLEDREVETLRLPLNDDRILDSAPPPRRDQTLAAPRLQSLP